MTVAAPPHPSIAVMVRDASRHFGEQVGVERLSLSIGRGELFGLVGPSGCGKTTLIRLLMGLLRPDEGDIEVNGRDPTAMRPRDRQALGYLPQEFSLFPTLSVHENCRFMAGLYGLGWWTRRRRIRDTLQFLELWDARKRAAADISGGMKRRLALAGALLHEPSILFIDEPTAGLDPTLRATIWEHLRAIQTRGATVVVTSQYIEEAERCDNVGVMRAGRLVALGTPEALRARAGVPGTIELRAPDIDGADVAAIWGIDGVLEVRRSTHDRLLISTADAAQTLPRLASTMEQRGRAVDEVQLREATFEEVFLQLVEAQPNQPEPAA